MTYVLKNPETGKWIDLDRASGGYPYEVNDVLRAHFWETADDAERYVAVLSSKNYENPVYYLYELQTTALPVPQRTGEDLENLRYTPKG